MRFDRPEQGFHAFVTACTGENPVGAAQILRQGRETPEVTRNFPTASS
jgi:hypothetical protein